MSNNDSPQSDLRASLATGQKRRRNILIAVIAVVVVALIAVVAGVSINAAKSPAEAAGTDGAVAKKPISVKIAVSSDDEFQDEIKKVAAEKGLDITWVNVKDWVLPNTELAAGTVDANAFQHILYLSAFNTENKDAHLTPVFSTVITQWGIFSKTLKAVSDIPDGGKIAIPDDPSNGGRALNILAAAHLITIASDAGNFPTTDDITSNPKNLKFVAIGATTIPQQFDDPSLSAVVVGTSYFDPSQGITSKDALFLDDSLSEKNLPYVNVIATREDNKNNPAWAILKKAYADPRVAAALKKESGGASVLVNVSVKSLRDKLAELETEAAAAK